ncbi:site-specific integrase [Phytopseudomonas punonensis]|uniref:Phage integrase family protein n=1 Tax=Phytopseudomonas punonensis TaxID=1220495 RepID=A0A1M7MFZ6_9GAMM|nr:site-specific integrase [Pseudomonas punonensis]SHM89700.1 Phage integrase family protein [Pseudomonas punonensis]
MATFVKMDSGRWRAIVRKKGHRQLSETFAKLADAKRWASDTELKIESIRKTGSASTPKGSTFADFVDKYVEETDPIKPHGKNKRASLQRLKREFANVLMSDMSVLVLNEFVTKRLKVKTQAGTFLSGVTIAGDLSYISTILHWARDVKMYNINAGMANEVRGALGRRGVSTRSKRREREPTQRELKSIYSEYIRKAGRQIIPMVDLIQFAIAGAMRQSEICGILIEDIDFELKTVVIRNRKHPEEKISNDQVVPLMPAAWNIAIKHIGNRKSGRVFNYDPKSVSSSFTRVCKKLEIVDLHFHDLRHTAIGNFFAIGLQIEQVALISGHKDWAMLKRYTHIKAKDVHRAFEDLLGKQSTKTQGA